jgi:hypothetical protein
MKEDDITSTLVTTLNLVFDTAHREVFTGEGKGDIYVEVERGNRTRKAYVGEVKFWDGQGKVREHLNQLFRYAPSGIRQVMLLYYVRAKNIDLIRRTGTASIQKCSTLFRHWEDGGAVAILKHPELNHDVQIAVLYAHFPK